MLEPVQLHNLDTALEPAVLDSKHLSSGLIFFSKVLDRGEGSWVYTTDGEKYLDFSTGRRSQA